MISGKGEHIYITRFNDVFSVMLQARVVICECYIKNILKYMRERGGGLLGAKQRWNLSIPSVPAAV